MGIISKFFGKVNRFIGNILKVPLIYQWLGSKKPYQKVGNEYVVYGLGGYVFGALNRLGNRFLFPGLKEIVRVPGGTIEQKFEGEQATTIDDIYLNLNGHATFKVVDPVKFYESDADWATINDLVLKYASSVVGNYKEYGLEAKIPHIQGEVVRCFNDKNQQKYRELNQYGVELTGLQFNTNFSEESNQARKGYQDLQAILKAIKARGDYEAAQIRAESTRKQMGVYLETARGMLEDSGITISNNPDYGILLTYYAQMLAQYDNDEAIAKSLGEKGGFFGRGSSYDAIPFFMNARKKPGKTLEDTFGEPPTNKPQ